MSKKHLRLYPHNVLDIKGRSAKDSWWYEEPCGLLIVTDNGTGAVIQRVIRWSAVRDALARRDKKE